MFRALAPLLFPLRCLNCREFIEFNLPLCFTCALSWSTTTKIRALHGIPFRYSCTYNSVTSRVILKAKEENNQRARTALALSIARALEDPAAILIPIPSRPSANRTRGFRHATLLAQAAISLAGGNRTQVIDCLRVTGSTKDQSGLNSGERQANLHKKFTVDNRATAHLTSHQIFIVDDLVTSGASAREAIRALLAANIRVNGVISACAALPH